MAMHISEIGIRLAVGEPARTCAAPTQPGGAAAASLTPQQIEALVQSCTQQVLHILRMLEAR